MYNPSTGGRKFCVDFFPSLLSILTIYLSIPKTLDIRGRGREERKKKKGVGWGGGGGGGGVGVGGGGQSD